MEKKSSKPAPAPTETRAKQSKVSSKPPVITAAAKKPSHEDIARRAYAIFESRGCADGYFLQDWLQAERELETRA